MGAAKSRMSLDNGYTSMLVTCGDFIYSYKLWFEDESGVECPIKTPLKPAFQKLKLDHNATFSRTWYKSLQNHLFPNKTLRCYELYSLYVSGINASSVVQYNDTITQQLKPFSSCS